MPKIVTARYEMGYGIQVNLSDRIIRVGNDKFMSMEDIEIPSEVENVQISCHEHGHSLVLVACDDKIVGVTFFHATIRPEAKEIITGLRQRGMSIYIISGDHEAPTKKLAETLGIENYFANTLPENTTHSKPWGKPIWFLSCKKRASLSALLATELTILLH